MKYSYEEALQRMRKRCDMRERSVFETRSKLIEWGATNSQTEKIITSLKSENYVDNDRFCRAFVLDKFRFKGWGKYKIAQALGQHRLDHHTIQKGLNQIPEAAYRETLLSLISRKDKQWQTVTLFDRKGKISIYLQSRGFETGLSWEMIEVYFTGGPS